jgi:hypothetical protein
MDIAVRENGTCIRCGERFGTGPKCRECGVARDRVVRRVRTKRINGKRGRNSGKVSQHGKKG